MTDVKSASPSRRERALATRRRIVAAAYRLFCDLGFAATTMETIAAEAGVAVQTVYFVFHTKGQLLKEVADVAIAGDDEPIPMLERPWVKESAAETDPRRFLAIFVEQSAQILIRVAPLEAAIRAAASVDEDAEAHHRIMIEQRRTGMRQAAGSLAMKTQLRAGLDVERAADLLFVLASPELFRACTTNCGWTLEEWKSWVHETLCQQLLTEHP